MDLKNKKVLILGLNAEGRAVFSALKKYGAQVFGIDLSGNSKNQEKTLQELQGFKSQIAFGVPDKLEDYSLVILSGLKSLYQKIIDHLEPQAQIMSVLEWVVSVFKSRFVGITGTNGKSTVAKCLEQMLLASGKKVFLGGGSFEPYASLLQKSSVEIAVLETSSIVLEETNNFSPHIAIVTNLVPSHFDRYETSHQYFRAKSRLFMNQKEGDYLIYDAENPYVEEWIQKSVSRHFPVYLSNPRRYSKNIQNFSYYEKGQFYFSREGSEIEMFSAENIRSQGRHMLMNALQALTAARLLGTENSKIQKVLDEFKGLPHRMQKCLEKNGLVFYDDARSSNPAATAWGLSRFSKPVILILGGMNQGADYKKLLPYLKKQVKLLIILGEGRRGIFLALKNTVDTYLVESLREAVGLALSKSIRGDTIVFSPAAPPEPHLYEGYSGRGEMYQHILEEELRQMIDTRKNMGLLKPKV